MKKRIHQHLVWSIICLITFFIFTVLVFTVDRQPIGPNGSTVGFATINNKVHNLTDVNWFWYQLTDLLSIVPFLLILLFATMGLIQWIRCRSVFKVDQNLIFLGVFYIVVLALFWLFDALPVNYRPVLIDGALEPSYPSSTTLLVMTTIPTAIQQVKIYTKHKWLYKAVCFLLTTFECFMVAARIYSGVHWITDIFAGLLLSAGLVMLLKYSDSVKSNK